jgi:hypothetical protein
MQKVDSSAAPRNNKQRELAVLCDGMRLTVAEIGGYYYGDAFRIDIRASWSAVAMKPLWRRTRAVECTSQNSSGGFPCPTNLPTHPPHVAIFFFWPE